MNISGNIVDIVDQIIYPATITVQNGFITEIRRENSTPYDTYILPGFIDAHVHIESSLLTPSEFARLATLHGTVAAVCDPHEIANVLGMSGIRFMIDNAAKSPFKFYFGAPSCVPATPYETAGGHIGIQEIQELLGDPNIHLLCEVMNFPAVIQGESEIMRKIAAAIATGKPIDGHAPGLLGNPLSRYAKAGVTTDHECVEIKEALQKISLGMRILIREGSAAKNFDALAPLIETHNEMCMLCSDDNHPDDLVKGHMNDLVRRSISRGIDAMSALSCATLNPVRHYKLDVGLVRENDPADFIIIDNLHQMNILKTYLRGVLVAQDGRSLLPPCSSETPNNFRVRLKTPDDFKVHSRGRRLHVIEAREGQIVTGCTKEFPLLKGGCAISDTSRDILKITVVNRYRDTAPAIGFIKNFGLTKGAIASSVAHDSHNIIAIGATDTDMSRCVNLIIQHGGGICAACDEFEEILPLPIGGIISGEDGFKVAESYAHLNSLVHTLGTTLSNPLMTLSFMALPVIPKLRITDRGLFDGDSFSFVDLFTE